MADDQEANKTTHQQDHSHDSFTTTTSLSENTPKQLIIIDLSSTWGNILESSLKYTDEDIKNNNVITILSRCEKILYNIIIVLLFLILLVALAH
jgi:hypothetical protein